MGGTGGAFQNHMRVILFVHKRNKYYLYIFELET